MKSNDTCQKCITYNGGCCVGVRLCIHGDELNPFRLREKNNQLPQGHVIKKWDQNKNLFMYISGKDKCLFLNKENKCSIYSERPLVCRTYPVQWKEQEKKRSNLFIDLSCPLAHEKPIQEMINWTKEPKNGKEMKKMGGLAFDGIKGRFISIEFLKKNFKALSVLKDTKNDIIEP
ncbi:MAG: hypothetical protein HeimC3_26520 [Candidatus Heimdallarchaeota archaeon LC_3]|nr:MAG: hypothetical protein HeimC3_26520 [Candidatus Heimdallarchaeota archaeon LC_3]